MKRLAAVALASLTLTAQADPGNPKQQVNEARSYGWTVARSTVDTLRRTGAKQAAITDWIADFDQAAAGTRRLNADALAGRNAKFWRAVYAMPPADPAMMTLHGALLLAAGEATRARYVLVLAAQHPRLTPAWRDAHAKLIVRSQSAGASSRLLVLDGLRLRNQRDYPGALEKMTDALLHWPQDPVAHWEIARTLREQAWETTRNLDAPDLPEVGAALARARQHDPLLLEAYQSGDPALRRQLMALLSNRGPAWLRLARHQDTEATPEMLERLASALQRAVADELALVAYQALRAHRGLAEPADRQFISVSLRALAETAP